MSLGLVIPTRDMASDLARLLVSVEESGLSSLIIDILVVDDGSSDDATAAAVRTHQHRYPHGKLRLHRLEQNLGRFLARKAGAQESRADRILFLDTRIDIPPQFKTVLQGLPQAAVQGSVRLEAGESLYSLYWERTHHFIFRQHYQRLPTGFWLTPDNFAQHLVGTTIFVCDKQLFLRACASFPTPPLSDDTALIQEICRLQPVWVSGDLYILWRPRQRLGPFLARLWERGSTFVAYHVYGPGSPLRRGFWSGMGLLLVNALLLAVDPRAWAGFVLAQLILLVLSTLLFTRRPTEALRMAPLHVAVVISFGAGILWGLWSERPRRRQA